jgi:hypothetical protein
MSIIDSLHQELATAHKASAIPYFHLNKISTTYPVTPYDTQDFYYDQVDVYIALSISCMDKEIELKRYLLHKYGDVIRVLVVEPY